MMKDKRKLYTFSLLAVCLAFSLYPVAFSGVSYWDVSTDWVFYSINPTTSGRVNFSQAVTTTQIYLDGSHVRFSNLAMGSTWNELGFHAPTSATMTVTGLQSDNVTLTPDPVGSQTFSVYVASAGSPVDVIGDSVESWNYANNIVYFTVDSTDSVKLSWTSPTTTITTESSGPTDFLTTMQTNIILALVYQFTGVMSNMFYVVLGLILMIPLYNRLGLLPIVGIGLLAWLDFQYVIPAYGYQIGMAIMALGGAIIITVAFLSRRRQYG